MNFIKNLIFSSLLIFTYGCAKENITKMGNGLIIEDIIIGEGEEAKDFNKVIVNYTGKLEDGSIFDSSLKPGRSPNHLHLH